MAEQNLTPPVPKKVEHRCEHHGDVFIDPTNGSSDKESEEVLNYLKAEAEYCCQPVTADQHSSANPSSTKSLTSHRCLIWTVPEPYR